MSSRLQAALLLAGTLAALGTATSKAPAALEPLAAAQGNQQVPAVVATGASYLVAWTDQGRATPRFADPGGPPPPPPPPVPTPPQAAVVTSRVSSTGQVRDPGGVAVSQAANITSRPRLAYSGVNSLAVWSDYSSEAPLAAIYGARISGTGAVTGNRITISERRTGGYMANIGVAFDGRNYLVVWQDYLSTRGESLLAARVAPDGTLLDTTAIPIADDAYDPVVAFDGANYMVAWWAYGLGRTVNVTRVTPSGAVLDPGGIVVGRELYAVPTPAIGFNGTNYLVAWPGLERPVGNHYLKAARVSPAGGVLDPTGIEIMRHGAEFLTPAVTSDGNNFLVVWQHPGPPCCWIYGVRLSPGGSVLDPSGIIITSESWDASDPAVAFNGSNYLVAWTDNRALESDIYGARVRRDGVVLDQRGILLSTTAARPPAIRCVVPRLVGLRLDVAQRRIRGRRCRVGKVRKVRVKAARRVGAVLSQKPRAGAIRRRGFPVTLVVGRR